MKRTGVESLNFPTMEGWLDNCVSNHHVVDSLTGMVQLYNKEVNSLIHATCYGCQSVTCK